MSSVIASIISSALGLVLNKARHSAADKLKDGDVIDEKLRDVIIEDLNDIKTKIDGLSRKDLLASYCFLKEGVVTLNLALDEAKDEEKSKDEVNGAQDGGSNTTSTTTRSESESGILNEAIALTQAIQELNNTSNGQLISAEKCFGDARREATRAFCNEALSLPDRIMAAQLRVVSKILECLQDTKAAVAGCMLFLEELHNLPGIGETFSTYFKGGMKSILYKDSRLENVKSVLSLNFAISKFVARFSSELPNVRNWPRIHLATRGETIHPLLLDVDVVKEIFDKEEFQIPENRVILSEIIVSDLVSMNSKGQILWAAFSGNRINILNRSGDIETFCRLRQSTANLNGTDQNVMALAIDRHDNVFVIIEFKYFAWKKNVLFVFDSNGNEQGEHVLHFINDGEFAIDWSCVVNNDGDLIIQDIWKNLFNCDNKGNLKSLLPIFSERNARLKCVTDQNETVMHKHSHLFVYTKEGKLKRTITIKNYIQSVTFNYVTSKIEVLVKNLESVLRWPSYSILSYSENDEVECLYLPVKRQDLWSPKFFSHPAGPAALIFPDNDIKSSRVVFM